MPFFDRSSVAYTGVQFSAAEMYAITDVNGDGHQDIVLMFHLYPLEDVVVPFRILLGDGTGAFTDATSTFFPGGAPGAVLPSEVLIADFNGDGRPDIFVGGSGYDASPFPGEQNRLLLSSGQQGLIDASDWLPQVSDFTHSATAGDIDGDGDIDLLVMNISGGTPASGTLTDPYFLINDGTGHFTREDEFLPPEVRPRNFENKYTSCLLFDADEDGDLDLFLGSHGGAAGNYSLLIHNDGSGNFAHATPLNLPAPAPWGHSTSPAVDAHSLDLNGDGRLDLVIDYAVDNYDSHFIQFLINDGAGGWRDESQERLPQPPDPDGEWFRDIDFADINGDGHADLIVRMGSGQPIYLNDGTGYFVNLPSSFLDTTDYYGVDWTVNYLPTDVNGDGRLDIIADVGANTQSGEYTIFVFTQQDPGPTQTGAHGADALLGDSSEETLSGLGGDDVIFGGGGNDVLSGGTGTDYLNGGAGADVFLGTAAELSGDTIGDFSIGDRIVISDASLPGFTYSISGSTLTYTGGTLTLSRPLTGRIAVSAAPGGGVQLLQEAIPPAMLLLTEPGQDYVVGGNVAVTGTTVGGETVQVLHGSVTLDSSFNTGGDRVVLPGAAGGYTAVLSGAFVTIANGSVSVAIPVGLTGLNVQFGDSTRLLRFDTASASVQLGSQTITSAASGVSASGPPLSDPAESGPSSLGRLILTAAGQDVDVGGNLTITGTTGSGEVITLLGGTVTLDSSFNAGGDTVVVPGASNGYSASLSGAFVTIVGGGISVSIPVGIVGLTVDFADGDRTLRFDTTAGQVMLGNHIVTTAGGTIAAAVIAPKDLVVELLTIEDFVDDGSRLSFELHQSANLEPHRIEPNDSFSFG